MAENWAGSGSTTRRRPSIRETTSGSRVHPPSTLPTASVKRSTAARIGPRVGAGSSQRDDGLAADGARFQVTHGGGGVFQRVRPVDARCHRACLDQFRERDEIAAALL